MLDSAFRILGEGQLSLTKFLLMTDGNVDLKDFTGTLEYVLARTDFATDLHVIGCTSMDTLDYAGPKVNEGSKGFLMGLGDPIRDLPGQFRGELPAGFENAEVFCRGCLVVDGPDYANEPGAARRLVDTHRAARVRRAARRHLVARICAVAAKHATNMSDAM